MIWAGFADGKGSSHSDSAFGKGYDELCALQTSIEAALRPLGFPAEKQFVPHVTLARVKHLTPEATTTLSRLIPTIPVHAVSFSVTWFGLYTSSLGTSGPTYTLLKKFEAKNTA